MTTSYSRNYCFNCGEEVDPDNWEEVGNTRLWICDKSKCHHELREEIRAFEEDLRQKAEDDGYSRYL